MRMKTIKKVFEIVCTMKSQKQAPRYEIGTGLPIDSWPASQKMISDQSFMQWVISYDKDNMPLNIVKIVSKMMEDDDIEDSKVQRCSKSVYSLYSWVGALLEYDALSKDVAPKREVLKKSRKRVCCGESKIS